MTINPLEDEICRLWMEGVPNAIIADRLGMALVTLNRRITALKAAGRLPEIEVTPEMVEAGVDALCSYDANHLPEPVVMDVYRAMARIAPWRGAWRNTKLTRQKF